MGRTVRTLREAVDIESAKWKTFRRQLRSDDRERLDKIFNYARMHADSGTVTSIPHKIDVVFIVGNMVSSHWFRLLNPHT